ncbi:MAG TPA: Gfo/Idh/MocA family oxidoreductase [Chloroflexota bacterium]|nr:Gfo/Idh/MocA family oxidoreductase [Chloroflexota bacterium]
MTTYRAGIVGLTGIAASRGPAAPSPALGVVHPGSHAAAYAQLPNVQVVGACDLVPERCEEFLRNWGDRWPDAETYGDYKAMLSAGKLDILSVVTSDHRHAQIVVDACEAGVKAIYCEKPIATTIADADRMVAAAKAHGVVMSIDHTRRWRPIWHQARDLIRAGEIGPLRRVVATLAGPRAMLFRNGTHLLDMTCFFADSDPEWVVAELDDEHWHYGPRYAGDGGRDPATDPGGSAYIRFKNGVRAFVNASKDSFSAWEFTLYCDRGRIRIDDTTAEVIQPGAKGLAEGKRLSWTLTPAQTTTGSLKAGIEELIAHVEARARGETPPALVSPPEAGRRVLEILLGILQSNHAGNAKVSFPVSDA